MLSTLLLLVIGAIALPPALAFLRSLIVIPLRLALGSVAPPPQRTPPAGEEWPEVTVQLAVYRESVVLERLVRSVVAMDYPPQRLVVQVVDDSEAAEAERCRAIVAGFAHQPVRVEYLNRSDRSGYKAGALNFGMQTIHTELIAFFDADFEPRADFLKALVPLFDDARVGGVQARWDYMNAGDSAVTQWQAGVFDKMFCFENEVRARLGRSALFLGSNGMFRKSALLQIGGWTEQPFTSEDLDLSYRIHVAGWKLLYDPRPLGKTELPGSYLPYLQQQRRWARGMTRVFLDHLGTMLTQRRQRSLELLEGSLIVFQVGLPFVALLPLLMLAALAGGIERGTAWFTLQAVLALALITPPVMVEVALSQRFLYADWRKRMLQILEAAPLAMGLSVSLLAGICETLAGSKAEFVRTPKMGELGIVRNNVASWLRGFVPIVLAQWSLATVAALAVVLALFQGYPEAVPLMLVMAWGFFISAWQAGGELRRKRQLAKRIAAASA